MGVNAQWHNEDKRIILITLEIVWTWDEMFNIIAKIHGMMEDVDQKTCTIWDMSRVATLPRNTLKHLKYANTLYHELSWYSVLVGMPRAFYPIYQVYHRVQGFSNPHGVHLYPSIGEAEAFLKQKIAEADDDT